VGLVIKTFITGNYKQSGYFVNTVLIKVKILHSFQQPFSFVPPFLKPNRQSVTPLASEGLSVLIGFSALLPTFFHRFDHRPFGVRIHLLLTKKPHYGTSNEYFG
jgi:hypothetical protein